MATVLSKPPIRIPVPTLANLRWYICGLLFFATTVNYIDRQVLGLLKPILEKELGWTESSYGWIVFAFQLAYALMMPLAGRAIDYLGTRLGYLIAVIVWSIAAAAHALAGSALGFGMARFANFPAAIKTVAVWFPQRERALATGIFNSGANIGALAAPLAVPYLALHYGWRSAFVATGAMGILWIVAWLWLYREPGEHPLLAAEERDLIRSGDDAQIRQRISYRRLLTDRAAWAFLVGKFLTDPVWWFYLFWLPGFLNRTYNVDLSNLGLPLVVIYQASMVGSIGGGWMSSAMIKRGWTVNRARKTAMLICAVAVTSAIFIGQTGGNLWLAVTLVSIAAAAHQGWSANIFSLPSDVFPQSAVGSVVGLGGMGGAIGGLLVSPAIGYWLDWSNGAYGPLFVVAGTLYLIALLIIHLLVPNLQKAS
jgi:ACS family hexuronate transporter-like MFS transporter